MNRRDLLGGLFWLGVSIFVCIESIRSDLKTFHNPGPGFMPFWSAVLLGTLAVIVLISGSLKKKEKVKIGGLWKGLEWHKVVWVSLSLLLYALVLPIMGYLITTFVLMTFCLGIMGRSKVWINVASALLITLGSYVIFYILLDIQLPKGIFNF